MPTPPNAFSAFFQGARDVWRGAQFILAHPGLWLWAFIPFLLNVVFFGVLAWAGWHFGGGWLQNHFLFAGHGFWAGLVGWTLKILFWIFYILIVYFLFVPLASLIASPFNDVLSEKVERIYAGMTAPGFSIGGMSRAIAVGLSTSLRLTLVSVALLVLVFPLNFIPGAGSLIWTGLSSAITIRFLSLQFTAYSMDRRFYTYRQRREFLARNRARTLGLGAMAFLIMLVPGLNALFIPVSAVAGTLLFCDTTK